jgi:nitrous oxide reductase accessory protein NosL
MLRLLALALLAATLAACATYQQAAPVDPVEISDHGAE